MLNLEIIKKSDPRLLQNMAVHYSQPKGFVGRSICYAILYDELYYGAIVGGSSTKNLPGRDEFFEISKNNKNEKLKYIINNIFYHIEKIDNKYPRRNFTVLVLNEFIKQVTIDWKNKYGDNVIGYESLVEIPRTGEIYLKAGWTKIETPTKGYTCKRIGGKGTDSWGGKRIWNYKDLRPKWVFVKHNNL